MPTAWFPSRRCVSAPVLAAATSFAQVAPADEPGSRFHLSWVRGEGADGCVDERELERGVRARLGRDPFSQDAAQSIEGDVSAVPGTFRAKLRVRDGAGALVGRRELEVADSDCRKLTDAIVLAIALVIDPRASHSKPLEASASAPSEPTPPGPSSADEASREGPLAASAPAPCPPPPRPPERACPLCRPSACPEQRSPAVVAVQASLRALGGAGILPNLAPGIGTSAAVGLSRVRFTAGISYFPEQDTGSDFAFGLSAAHLGACVRANPFGALTPSMCTQLQVGAMHAVVRELQPLRTGDHAWAAVGLGPELGIRPLGPLILEASVLGVLPVLRPRFAVRGDPGSVFQSEWLGAVASVGIGILLP